MQFARPLLMPLILALMMAGGTAQGEDGGRASPPSDLQGHYEAKSQAILLTWSAPQEGLHQVYRDATLLTKTSATSWRDPALPSDHGFVYFVVAKTGNQTWSEPAIVAVPTLTCEIVNVTTSWNWPYADVQLHEECLGITYDKSFTWTAPQ